MATRLDDPRWRPPSEAGAPTLPPRLLAAIAAGWATTVEVDSLDQPDAGERTYRRLLDADAYDVWLIRWGAGSSAPLHDHAGSAGALHVVEGALYEEDPSLAGAPVLTTMRRGPARVFDRGHVHEVRNETAEAAASIHVYSLPLRAMTYYTRSVADVLLPLYRTPVDEVVP